MSLVNFSVLEPRFRLNYNVGYIGFVSGSGPVARGIAHFEGPHALSKLRVTHTLIVTGENQCVEANKGEGVRTNPLTNYFDSTTETILFRRPIGYTEELGWRIVESAIVQVGRKYDDLLIAGFAMGRSVAGRALSQVFGELIPSAINNLFDSRHRWICSELVAYALNAQPELTGRGILSKPINLITPQALFEDRVIFES